MSITLVFYPGVVHSVVAPISNGISPLSTVSVYAFAVSTRISSSRSTSWKIKGQGISSQKAIKFDSLRRIHVTGWLESASLVRPVVWPIDNRNFVPSVSFDVRKRTSATKLFRFNARKRLPAKHTEFFDVRNYMFAHAQVRFNTLLRVHKPGVTIGGWVNQIGEPVVKPIYISNSSASPYVTWNSQKTKHPKKIIRFNNHGRLSVTKQIEFNDYGTLVISRKQILWDTLERI